MNETVKCFCLMAFILKSVIAFVKEALIWISDYNPLLRMNRIGFVFILKASCLNLKQNRNNCCINHWQNI